MFIVDTATLAHQNAYSLVIALSRMARAYRTRFLVVFEGPPIRGLPHGHSARGIRIVHATGSTKTCILEMVREWATRESFVVVTGNSRLAEAVRVFGVPVYGAIPMEKAIESHLPLPIDRWNARQRGERIVEHRALGG